MNLLILILLVAIPIALSGMTGKLNNDLKVLKKESATENIVGFRLK